MSDEVVSYDVRNRVTARQVVVANSGDYVGVGGTYKYNYTFNAADQQLSVQFPALNGSASSTVRETVLSGYVSTGQAFSLVGAATYVGSSNFDAAGRLFQRWSVSGGTNYVRQVGYDGLNRLSSAFVWNTGVLHQQDYFAYDAAGNVTSINHAADSGQVECFSYDDRQRLVRAFTTNDQSCVTPNVGHGPVGYHEAWTYAANGNMLRHGTVGGGREDYSYGSSKPHAVTALNGGTSGAYGYDLAGNVTTRTRSGAAGSMGYDGLGRLCWSHPTVVSTAACDAAPGGATRYVYGVGTQRTLRIDSASSKTLYLDGVEIQLVSGTKTYTRYYTLGGVTVALRKGTGTANTNGTVTWLFGNQQGSSSVAFVGPNATTSQKNRYLPYGARRGADAITGTEHGWIGQLEDPTGLNYLNARYYDNTIGRFMAVDPIGHPNQPQSLNGYSYGFGNPVMVSDATGLDGDTGAINGVDYNCLISGTCNRPDVYNHDQLDSFAPRDGGPRWNLCYVHCEQPERPRFNNGPGFKTGPLSAGVLDDVNCIISNSCFFKGDGAAAWLIVEGLMDAGILARSVDGGVTTYSRGDYDWDLSLRKIGPDSYELLVGRSEHLNSWLPGLSVLGIALSVVSIGAAVACPFTGGASCPVAGALWGAGLATSATTAAITCAERAGGCGLAMAGVAINSPQITGPLLEVGRSSASAILGVTTFPGTNVVDVTQIRVG